MEGRVVGVNQGLNLKQFMVIFLVVGLLNCHLVALGLKYLVYLNGRYKFHVECRQWTEAFWGANSLRWALSSLR